MRFCSPTTSFPSFGRGFDSHRPLHKSRRFNCLYATESLKIPREMVDLDARWTPPPSIGRCFGPCDRFFRQRVGCHFRRTRSRRCAQPSRPHDGRRKAGCLGSAAPRITVLAARVAQDAGPMGALAARPLAASAPSRDSTSYVIVRFCRRLKAAAIWKANIIPNRMQRTALKGEMRFSIS